MQRRNSIIGDNYRWPHVVPYVLDDSLGTVFAMSVCLVDCNVKYRLINILWHPFIL